MSDPFEIIEIQPDQDTGESHAPLGDLISQLSAGENYSSTVNASRQAVRQAVAEVVRQRSDLADKLDDLQEETVHRQRRFYLKLLTVIDSLDRLLRMLNPANEATETINAIRVQFINILESVEIYPIELAPGQEFDAETCEVSTRQERPDLPSKTIISVERRGYTWGARVLRQARVIIAS